MEVSLRITGSMTKHLRSQKVSHKRILQYMVGNAQLRVLPRKNPQSGTRFDKVCHIAELEGIMLEGIYGNYYYRGNKFILC